MKNPALNNAILKILARVECGLKEKTLMAETELAMDAPGMTSFEFKAAISYLEDKGFISTHINAIGWRVWEITAAGRDALKGL